MLIKDIPGVEFIPGSHRCYEYILDFVIATCAVGRLINLYHNQPVESFAPNPKYPFFLIKGQASGRNVGFIPHDMFTSVYVNNSRQGTIPYVTWPAAIRLQPAHGHTSDAVIETIEGFAQAMLTRYFENYRDSIEARHGDRKNWPPVLRFGAVVRDAMSHGGTVNFKGKVAPVSHFGLNYSVANNGRKIMHNDLTCADIFLLMLEMDAAF